MSIVKGATITLTAQFKNDSGENTSPSTPVEITVTRPDGTKAEDGTIVTEDSSTDGLFEFNYDTTQAGTLYYKFVSADGGVEQGSTFINKDNTEQ